MLRLSIASDQLREGWKKTIESMSMLIPRGGGSVSQRSHLLWFFSPCSKPICLGQRSSKTDFLFTPNSIFHIVSHLSDHLDQASHLKIVELVSSFTCIALLKFCIKPYKICFTPYLITQINQKRCKKNNQSRSQ